MRWLIFGGIFIWFCCDALLVVSGVVPKEPVVAKTSGLVFEKALVEKVLRVEEKCPVTGAPLRSDDLITIQGTIDVRNAFSIL